MMYMKRMRKKTRMNMMMKKMTIVKFFYITIIIIIIDAVSIANCLLSSFSLNLNK